MMRLLGTLAVLSLFSSCNCCEPRHGCNSCDFHGGHHNRCQNSCNRWW